jgi:hypothetical protein
MKKIPQVFLIKLINNEFSSMKITNLIYSKKHILKYDHIIIPPKDFKEVSHHIRHRSRIFLKVHKFSFEITSLDSFESYCRYIADHITKRQMMTGIDHFNLHVRRYPRPHVAYIQECFDFLLAQVVRGNPFSQLELSSLRDKNA